MKELAIVYMKEVARKYRAGTRINDWDRARGFSSLESSVTVVTLKTS